MKAILEQNESVASHDVESFLDGISRLRMSKLARGNLYVQRGLVSGFGHRQKLLKHDQTLAEINEQADIYER